MEKTLPIQAPLINKANLEQLLKEHKLSADEYELLLSIVGRFPTMSELGIFSAMWSEHCSYKSSRIHLRKLPTTGEQVVVGPGENAGVVRISGKKCIAFKMESHNHPSYIEPYQGAATGVGGIMRDVFCMGARPIANLNCLRFGKKSNPRTAHLLKEVVRGIGDYGNCVGVPTVGGSIHYDDSYDGNCLVNAMTIGVIDENKIFKGFASGVGNYVVYVGSATGRDGIHGATMASDSFADNSGSSKTTIQVGDPFMENLLIEATLEVLQRNLVVGLQDMGAACLTSSAFEMADRAGNGLFLDFNKVPTRTKNKMSAYELLLSESQERMLMVVEPTNWKSLKEVLDKWQLSAAIIGEVTDTKRVQVVYDGLLEVDLPVTPLAEQAPKYNRPTVAEPISKSIDYDQFILEQMKHQSNTQLVEQILKFSGDKKFIYKQYDYHIGCRTVLGPESQGAAVLWLQEDENQKTTHEGVAVCAGSQEEIGKTNSKIGASLAVVKLARMISAAGGKPLAITDCLNFGNPQDPKIMNEFVEAIDGISEACLELNTPVVSGNVSLYNETAGQSIAPTPMIGMVGKVDDIRYAKPANISQSTLCYVLRPTDQKYFSMVGSLIAKFYDEEKNYKKAKVEPINYELEKRAMSFVLELSQNPIIHAIRDVAGSGLLTTIYKMTDYNIDEETKKIELRLRDNSLTKKMLFGLPQATYIIAATKNLNVQAPDGFVLDYLGEIQCLAN